jgi:hypothetical protein
MKRPRIKYEKVTRHSPKRECTKPTFAEFVQDCLRKLNNQQDK